MTTEAWLAWGHLMAFLALAVFLTSQTALCRAAWLNAAVVERLARLDLLYWASAAAVLASGLARLAWGVKGAGFYALHPLLHLKWLLFGLMLVLAVPPARAVRRWRRQLRADGRLPDAAEPARVRRWLMWQAHVMPLLPLAAVFLARGWLP